MAEEDGLVTGPDGRARCWWCVSAPEYIAYHDAEWGFPVRDDRRLQKFLHNHWIVRPIQAERRIHNR